MSAAVSLPPDPDDELDPRTCFEIARTQVARCMKRVALLQREADVVLEKLAPAHVELEMWTDIAEEASRVIARRHADEDADRPLARRTR